MLIYVRQTERENIMNEDIMISQQIPQELLNHF